MRFRRTTKCKLGEGETAFLYTRKTGSGLPSTWLGQLTASTTAWTQQGKVSPIRVLSSWGMTEEDAMMRSTTCLHTRPVWFHPTLHYVQHHFPGDKVWQRSDLILQTLAFCSPQADTKQNGANSPPLDGDRSGLLEFEVLGLADLGEDYGPMVSGCV
ncbi:hypothetical protein GE21DRAFT_1135980 [Neurospora crassa]|nr:hypothetical protein GE21DRAFT_1135980 [Neurospora crassa]